MRVTRELANEPPIHVGRERITNWQLGRISPCPPRVPDRWELVKILSVARLESGHTPSRNRPDYWDGAIPWISLHDTDGLHARIINRTAISVSELGLQNSSARLLPAGTVVFSRTATVGKCSVMGREMATSQDFANYVCGPRLNNQYLMYLFRYMGKEWDRLMAGSTHNTIYMPVFQKLEILLPPIAEQEAIAEALGDADALVESLERLLAKKRNLKQAAMQQLLTGKKRLPGFEGEWEVSELRGRVNLRSGHHVLAQYCNQEGLGTPYLTGPSDFPDGAISHSKFTTKPTTLCQKDDILVTVKGSGCGTLVKADSTYCISRQLMAITVQEGDFRFIYYSLLQNASDFQDAAAGLIPGLSRSDVLGQELPFPPSHAEQTAIATVLSDMDAEIAAIEAKIDKARQIKAGMMQELLTGKTRLVSGGPA